MNIQGQAFYSSAYSDRSVAAEVSARALAESPSSQAASAQSGTPQTASDSVTISGAQSSKDSTKIGESKGAADSTSRTGATSSKDDKTTQSAKGAAGKDDPSVREEISKLKSRDAEVKTHEQAHIAAGGRYILSGPRYDVTTGPDGLQYAVGGEVSIDTGEVPHNPLATINKMEVVKRAALAPAQPSSQDYSVASKADDKAASASEELTRKLLAHIILTSAQNLSESKGSLFEAFA